MRGLALVRLGLIEVVAARLEKAARSLEKGLEGFEKQFQVLEEHALRGFEFGRWPAAELQVLGCFGSGDVFL